MFPSLLIKSQFVLNKRICHIIRLSENTHPSKQTFTNYEIFYQLQQLKATELADNILQSCELELYSTLNFEKPLDHAILTPFAMAQSLAYEIEQLSEL